MASQICKAPGCSEPVEAEGFCRRCQEVWDEIRRQTVAVNEDVYRPTAVLLDRYGDAIWREAPALHGLRAWAWPAVQGERDDRLGTASVANFTNLRGPRYIRPPARGKR